MTRRTAGPTFAVNGGTAMLLRDPDARATFVLEIDGYRQSHVDLQDPTHLGFDYMRRMGHVVDLLAPLGEAIDAVHLGGGALTLPRYIAATRAGSRQRIFEIDEELTAVVRRELPLQRQWNIRIGAHDALDGIRSLRDASADLVVADVYAGGKTPAHLRTRDVVAQAARVLRPGGAYVVNVIDEPVSGSARQQIAHLRTCFAQVAAIAGASRRGSRLGNVVLVGSDMPWDLAALGTRVAADRHPGRLVAGDALARL
jgi:spermidine synthase